jgi:outer membrane receptor protein involved in Fe transport
MRQIFTLLAGLMISISSLAQTKGAVSGKITDQQNKAMQSATVSLLKGKDSSVVKFTVTDKAGNFQFENITPGQYLVSITAVGHAKAYSEKVDIKENAISLKTIELLPQSKSLGGVTVTSNKPFIEQKIDRTIVNVEASVTNVGNSALEVLEKSPGITVDKDGNISLKGKEGVVVLVDNRPTYLSGPDLANLLRSMQASQLDQIEIMTNPPAKYDAAGNAGVINIKTKKNKQFGYNGSATVGYGQWKYPKFNESLNFNYRKNKVNFFTNLGHNRGEGWGVLAIKRNFRDKDTKGLLSSFDQETRRRNNNNTFNGKIGMDYFAGKNTTFGIVVNGFTSDNNRTNRTATDIFDTKTGFLTKQKGVSSEKQEWNNFSTNLNFRQVLDTTGEELTADLDYITYNSSNATSLLNFYYDGAGADTDRPDTLLGSLPQDIKIYSGKMDYLLPLKKGAKFEAGLKSSIVKTDNNAGYDSILNGGIVHDFNRSNYFIYQENINAAYANLSGSLSKKWNAQLGLRLENTNAKGNQVTTGEKFDRQYTQLFPTAYLQYLANKNNSFVLNYGRRIRRPNYQSLNPFISFLDRYTYQQGNPNLKPQFSHNIELSNTYKNFFTTTLNYSRTTDIIQELFEQNEEKNETYVKQSNIAKQRQFGISVNANKPITKWWTSNMYVNVYNNKFDGIANNTPISISATTLVLNGSQQFKFAKTWNAEISGFFRTGGIEGVLQMRSLGMMSVGFGKQVMKGKGSVRLNIRDILYVQQFKGIIKYSNIDASVSGRNESRVANISFSYRFSKGKMGGAPKRRASSANDEQNRVGAGN